MFQNIFENRLQNRFENRFGNRFENRLKNKSKTSFTEYLRESGKHVYGSTYSTTLEAAKFAPP